ncbi:Serine/threonine-protein phosphatase 6 regulatory ankyrin repeat subunit A [Trichoplax sp. H2]|nr:Serine/threonine-protein phosphatase 6 regulatory ankyrin repeat subunit A [Trichoplax sp. H2]|eukprot:RDD43929.1 Serine/threonine-protein phosphatase 6 regulatory ankyrin repeat subunit A [Trichoplax sp. H2]
MAEKNSLQSPDLIVASQLGHLSIDQLPPEEDASHQIHAAESTPGLTLQDLPDEILTRVMEFLLGCDVARMACCCRAFAYIASSKYLWKQKIMTELTSKPVLVDGDTYYRYYSKSYLGYKYHQRLFPRFKPPSDTSLRCYYQFVLGSYNHNYQQMIYDSTGNNNNSLKSTIKWISYVSSSSNNTGDRVTEINLFLIQAMRDGFDVWGSTLIRLGADINRYAADNKAKRTVPFTRNFGNSNGGKYNHPVRVAIVKGHTHCLRLLLNRGANINHLARKRVNSTLFHLAAFSHQMECLQVLITKIADAYVMPSLHKLVMCNNIERLRSVLKTCSVDEVNEQDRCCCTALWWALILGYVECVGLLLTHHARTAKIGGANESRQPTMSALAAVLRWKQLDCLKLLVQNRYCLYEDLQITEYLGNFNTLEVATRSNFSQGVQYLISEHSFSPRSESCRALLLAATHGCCDSLQVLINEGAVIDQRIHLLSTRERDPLRRIDMFLQLLQAEDYHLFCPLLSTAKYYHPECMQLLLKAGANTNIIYGDYGSIPKTVALLEIVVYNYFKKISLQPDKNPMTEELDILVAIVSNNQFDVEKSFTQITAFNCLKLLLEHGSDVNACYENGRTVLHELLCCNNKPQFNHSLFQTRFDKLIEHCLNMCILYNADVNKCDKGANSPLHEAAASLKPSWIALLLNSGARPNILNKNLVTPRQLIKMNTIHNINIANAAVVKECVRLLFEAEKATGQVNLM